ncbi:MAG: sulfate adenylyltransferase subunit CysN [Proteobacteria bacterium]|nr:sulfate adenylyltransferase subunit CysN [Pseudomonadota bacterium]
MATTDSQGLHTQTDKREHDDALIRSDIEGYLSKYEQKELLRFVAVGSVDDGKSTLIGRMLHDTGMVYEDQLAAVKSASKLEDGEIDFSLLTDGLRAEREQGITIDVAYRYFSTDIRKFIIADTPGHIQYTRNMVTGASTANVGIILIDARLGVLPQSRRHATIASLLGIPHLAVCVNKMDLVDYDQQVFERIRMDFREFAKDLSFKDITFFPVSALKGVNIVEPSEKTPWYDGANVLQYLETVEIHDDNNTVDFRFPVQSVLRPNLNYRGFAGQIASGGVKKGDTILTLPSGKSSVVEAVDVLGVEAASANVPQSVTIRLEDEIDISRGDMIVRADNLPTVSRTFEASLVWMSEGDLDTQKSYLLKHTTQTVRAQVDTVHFKMDMESLENVPGSLALNDIGRVSITCTRALYFDDYSKNRATGSFILIDSLTNNTVAAGMIEAKDGGQDLDDLLKEARAGSAIRPKTQVSPRERFDRLGQHGATIWLTGLPGSGRWALAYALERRLFDQDRTATVVDPTGEDLAGVSSACRAATDAGMLSIAAYPSFKRADRAILRERVGAERVLHVYVNTDEGLCRERRPNADFSGFEAPMTPDVTLALDAMRLSEAVDTIIAALEARGQFERPTG